MTWVNAYKDLRTVLGTRQVPDKWVSLSQPHQACQGCRKTALGREKGEKESLNEVDSPLSGGRDCPKSHSWRPVTVSAMNLPRVPLAITHSAPLFIGAKP